MGISHASVFFLSGITTKATSYTEIYPAIAKSIKSIVVPYLFFSLLSILLWWPAELKAGNSIDPITILCEMAFGVSGSMKWMPYNVPLWFFTCLFSVRLIFLILSSWLKTPDKILAYSIILAALGHSAFAFALPRLPWNLDVAFIGVVFCSTGYWISNRKNEFNFLTWKTKALLFLVVVMIVWWVAETNGRVDMNGRSFNNPALFYLGAYAGITGIVLLANLIKYFRLVSFIGLASVVIFPMHGLLLYFLPDRTISILSWYSYQVTNSLIASAMLVGALQVILCIPFYWLLFRYLPFAIGHGGTPRRANYFS